MFSPLLALLTLDLSNNKLGEDYGGTIQPEAFSRNGHLANLKLSQNRINVLGDNVFKGKFNQKLDSNLNQLSV